MSARCNVDEQVGVDLLDHHLRRFRGAAPGETSLVVSAPRRRSLPPTAPVEPASCERGRLFRVEQVVTSRIGASRDSGGWRGLYSNTRSDRPAGLPADGAPTGRTVLARLVRPEHRVGLRPPASWGRRRRACHSSYRKAPSTRRSISSFKRLKQQRSELGLAGRATGRFAPSIAGVPYSTSARPGPGEGPASRPVHLLGAKCFLVPRVSARSSTVPSIARDAALARRTDRSLRARRGRTGRTAPQGSERVGLAPGDGSRGAPPEAPPARHVLQATDDSLATPVGLVATGTSAR